MTDETTSAESRPPTSDSAAPAAETRRNILVEGVTAIVSFLLIAVPSTLAGLFFMDPILRKRKSDDGGGEDMAGFIKLDLTADAIPADGTPVAVTVKSDLVDAWNRFKDVPVGSIWLRRSSEGAIQVFNAICPHLGCSVNFRRSENDFFCPCHTSAFSLDGAKTNEVPPRDMDSLELKTATDGVPASDGLELWVKFQNFKGATSEKVPV